RGVQESLDALRTDYIDLYQVHWPDPRVPFEATAGALADFVTAGTIRHVGVSNFDAAQMKAFGASLPVETLQPPYHLFRRDIEESILPYPRLPGRWPTRPSRCRLSGRATRSTSTMPSPPPTWSWTTRSCSGSTPSSATRSPSAGPHRSRYERRGARPGDDGRRHGSPAAREG